MQIIQIESIDFLNNNNYPANKDFIITKEDYEDSFEDGCVVGLGYSDLTELLDEDFESEERRILSILGGLGCEVDRLNGIIYFTDEFCINYGKDYFLALQEKMKSLTPEEYTLTKTADELKDLRELLVFNDVEVGSATLNAFLTNFDELTQRRFASFFEGPATKVERVGFKIVSIMNGC